MAAQDRSQARPHEDAQAMPEPGSLLQMKSLLPTRPMYWQVARTASQYLAATSTAIVQLTSPS